VWCPVRAVVQGRLSGGVSVKGGKAVMISCTAPATEAPCWCGRRSSQRRTVL
jgi:hypothetical protein